MAGSKSLFVNAVLSTTSEKLSPVIDLQRCSAITVQNRINSPTTGNTPNFVDDTASSGTSSAAVYLTRPIVLENPSTALEVRLTQNVRSVASVQLFYRNSSAEESRDINELSWTPFNVNGEEDILITPSESDESYKEYKYSAENLSEFTTFQIKIVMKSTNSAYVPKIRDMRGIALAV